MTSAAAPRELRLSLITIVNNFSRFPLDFLPVACYIYNMKLKKLWKWLKMKARVNKDGLMGSASREHRVKKGKGSFRRRKKHQKKIDTDS